jgi:enterobactin synthetase component D / holo-[acyl-carrier protein] synthase
MPTPARNPAVSSPFVAQHSIAFDTEDGADLAARMLESIAAPEEVSALVRATGWTTALVLTLVFSAKESVLKCLYPEVRRYFDFRDAWVSELDPASARFSVRLLTRLAPGLPGGRVRGRFERDEGSVCTAMVLPP